MMNPAARIRIAKNRDYHQYMADQYKEAAEREQRDATENGEPSTHEKMQAMHQDVAKQLSAVLADDSIPVITGQRGSQFVQGQQIHRTEQTSAVRKIMIGSGRIH